MEIGKKYSIILSSLTLAIAGILLYIFLDRIESFRNSEKLKNLEKRIEILEKR